MVSRFDGLFAVSNSKDWVSYNSYFLVVCSFIFSFRFCFFDSIVSIETLYVVLGTFCDLNCLGSGGVLGFTWGNVLVNLKGFGLVDVALLAPLKSILTSFEDDKDVERNRFFL
eukprot:635216_1